MSLYHVFLRQNFIERPSSSRRPLKNHLEAEDLRKLVYIGESFETSSINRNPSKKYIIFKNFEKFIKCIEFLSKGFCRPYKGSAIDRKNSTGLLRTEESISSKGGGPSKCMLYLREFLKAFCISKSINRSFLGRTHSQGLLQTEGLQ